MAAQTQVYLYNQRSYVVLLEAASSGKIRYNKVYAKDLILNRGVDNLIEFQFINQEQKPVNISNKEITARLINSDGKKILLQKTLVDIYPLTGIAGLRVSSEELDNIDSQLCYYSIEIPADEFDYPVFVDAECGARGVIRIVNSVLPTFVPSYELTIPAHAKSTIGNAVSYYSSSFYTKQQNFYTFQLKLERFTGSICFQGSTLSSFSYPYNITNTYNFDDSSETLHYNVEGFHPFIRMKIVNTGTPQTIGSSVLLGDITKLLVR